MTGGQARHEWNLTPREAVRVQRELASLVHERPLSAMPELIAGADLAFTRDGRRCLAGIVLWHLDTRRVVEETLTIHPVEFPYIPGLLSFREAPAVLAAAKKLQAWPDAWILDGHGRSHPRRFGLASHLGVLLDRPAIGCAKTRLCGQFREPGLHRGARCELTDGDDTIGTVVRTRDRVKPVFVSVGHRVTLGEAVTIVLACVTKYRLPEPTRLAHQLVTKARGDLPAYYP